MTLFRWVIRVTNRRGWVPTLLLFCITAYIAYNFRMSRTSPSSKDLSKLSSITIENYVNREELTDTNVDAVIWKELSDEDDNDDDYGQQNNDNDYDYDVGVKTVENEQEDVNQAEEGFTEEDEDSYVFEDEDSDYEDSMSAPCSGNDTPCTQGQRFNLLHQVCNKYPELEKPLDLDSKKSVAQLFVNDKHKMMFCAMPKAASTMLFNMFYYSIKGEMPEDGIHCTKCWKEAGLVYLNSFPKEERIKKLNSYFKVLVIRHPLDRLVSCWNGKLREPADHKIATFHKQKMIELFRNITSRSMLKDEMNKGATFTEFVKYINLLEGDNGYHNTHWNPHYRMCHPCAIEYDYILKLETMEEDSGEIMRRLELDGTGFPLINARRTDEGDKMPSNRFLEEYGELSSSEREKIEQMYKYDMELFGYSWNSKRNTAMCGDSCRDKCC